MKRIFIALWPAKRTATAIDRVAAGWAWPEQCRRYPPRDLHLTLHFIGACADDKIETVRRNLRVPMEPFTLALDAPRRWPKGLAVLCPSIIPPALTHLHEALAQALGDCEVDFDHRTLLPHVTLARHCRDIALPETCEPIPWAVRQYALIQSTGDARQRYVALRTYGES